jgi:hypothetical protein
MEALRAQAGVEFAQDIVAIPGFGSFGFLSFVGLTGHGVGHPLRPRRHDPDLTVVHDGRIAGAHFGRFHPSAVTFNKDVLPILQKNCQGCHRPGEVAPMSSE